MAVQPFSEEHGGMDPSELKRMNISPDALIDFSVNSNPFGPSPRVLEALRLVDVAKYPDRFCVQLKNQLAVLNKIEDTSILIGNGTSELIWLVTLALLNREEKFSFSDQPLENIAVPPSIWADKWKKSTPSRQTSIRRWKS